jgi:hypothetical protein
MQSETVVISKSVHFEQYLKAKGIIQDGYYEVIPNPSHKDVEGKIIIGMKIPLYIAACAMEVIDIPLFVPTQSRNEVFSVEFFEKYAGKPTKYVTYKMEG